LFRLRTTSGGLAERIEPTTNMDVDADTAAIQRIKAAEEKMAKIEIKAEQRMTRMETKFEEKLNSILQAVEGKETWTNVPTEEVPDEHQDWDEQAWMEDEVNRETRTKQFPPTSNVTDIHAIERTINLGNTIFRSYGWVAEQIEAALKSRQKQDLTYGIGANANATVTPDTQQEKGNKQKKAIYTKLRTITWNGQCPILEWVKLFCDALREYSVSALTLEERNLLPWNSIHYEKRQPGM